MNQKVRLVRPAEKHKEEALSFRKAFFEVGEDTIDGSELLDRMDSYEEWLSFVTDNRERSSLREGSVLTDTYFALDEEERIVGIIDLRHELNDFFKDFGHCGYSVLPAERRKGYATAMLGLIKELAKEAGLTSLQLSALRSNTPSLKTIINNGGKLSRSFLFYSQMADVYLIDLKE